MNKYSTLLKETETKEQSIKTVNEKINELNRVIKNNEEKISSILAKFGKEKQNYEEKITSMFGKINELTKENDNLKKENEKCKTQNEENSYKSDFYNSIIIVNEQFQSEMYCLNNKIEELKISNIK
jgi:predicted  nucleic acid-binding Zn-ribbon protein